jgi:heterodisulfide reductase subunit A
VLVVGGGITGLQAAASLAGAGVEVLLAEREERLGGNLKSLGATFGGGTPAPELIDKRAQAIASSSRVTVLTGTEVVSLGGAYPHLKASLTTPDGTREMECRSIILATGFTPFNPARMRHYAFGTHPDVITSVELADKLKGDRLLRNSDGEKPGSLVFIQCIGSRELRTHTYCSAFCCMYAVHCALQVKERLPRCRVEILYMDMRTPFCAELEYEAARRKGIGFIRSKPAAVRAGRESGRLTVQYEDTLDGALRFLETDMVVLSVGAEPPRDAASMAESLGIATEESGFFAGEPAPVFTRAKGVFVAGAAGGPKDIRACLAEGMAAAAQAAIVCKE